MTEAYLTLESIDLFPCPQDRLLGLWKIYRHDGEMSTLRFVEE